MEIRHMHEVQKYEVVEGKNRYEVERKMVLQDGSVKWTVVHHWDTSGGLGGFMTIEGVERERLIRAVQKHLGVY